MGFYKDKCSPQLNCRKIYSTINDNSGIHAFTKGVKYMWHIYMCVELLKKNMCVEKTIHTLPCTTYDEVAGIRRKDNTH
jgi:hypothetical protein